MNTYTSIENWRIFISAVPMGQMHHLFSLNGLCAVTCSSAKLMMSLLSCWLHVKLFFSAVLNTHVSYFPVTSRTHTESTASYYWALQHWPLLFFAFFSMHYEILVLWYSEKIRKNLLALTSVPIGCRSAVLSPMPPATHLFQHWVQCPWKSHLLSVILSSLWIWYAFFFYFSRMGCKWCSVLHSSEEP